MKKVIFAAFAAAAFVMVSVSNVFAHEYTTGNSPSIPVDTTGVDSVAPAAEQPVAEQPAAETPSTEQPAAETPSAEQPAAETPSTEQPAAETPSTEQPAEAPSAE